MKLALAFIAVAIVSLPGVQAETYPTRRIEVVVPFAPGGGSDVAARLLAEGLTDRLHQTAIVTNRPGANTNIGTLSVARANPDGYTLGIASVGLTANPLLYKNLNFDPRADIAPVSLLVNSPTILVVPPELPVKTVAEFIAYAKQHPGELNYGSYGVGSGPQIAAELFSSLTGVRLVHVPYGGGGPAVVAAMSNQVQALFSSLVPVLSQVQSGKLRAIAIAADQRSELFPSVPTFKEEGLNYVTGTWFGLFAPLNTPNDVIDTLSRSAVAIFSDKENRAKMLRFGADVVASTPDGFRKFIKDDMERLEKVVRNAGMTLD